MCASARPPLKTSCEWPENGGRRCAPASATCSRAHAPTSGPSANASAAAPPRRPRPVEAAKKKRGDTKWPERRRRAGRKTAADAIAAREAHKPDQRRSRVQSNAPHTLQGPKVKPAGAQVEPQVWNQYSISEQHFPSSTSSGRLLVAPNPTSFLHNQAAHEHAEQQAQPAATLSPKQTSSHSLPRVWPKRQDAKRPLEALQTVGPKCRPDNGRQSPQKSHLSACTYWRLSLHLAKTSPSLEVLGRPDTRAWGPQVDVVAGEEDRQTVFGRVGAARM